MDRARETGIRPPALIVVGRVVDYRGSLAWFETRPLFGRTFLITRPRHQSAELTEALELRGAAVVSLPAIEIEEPEDPRPLGRALDSLPDYDYLVFTSVNGVTAFFRGLQGRGLDSRALAGLVTVCIGKRTAAELEGYHVRCDRMPEKFVAEHLLGVFEDDLSGKKVLIPRALEAREVLPEGLRARGATVDVVPVYRTVAASPAGDVPDDVDMALFTSSSAAEHFLNRSSLPVGCRVASIGPITARTLHERGVTVDVEAETHTVPGLVKAVTAFAESGGFDREQGSPA